jgi:hypothetical protein
VSGPSPTLAQNHLQHPVQILQHFVIPEPQHAIALCFEGYRAALVLVRSACMLAAVDFNDQLQFLAQEVGEVRTARMLAPKLEADEPAGAQSIPEPAFGVRGLRAQLPRTIDEELALVRRSGAQSNHDSAPCASGARGGRERMRWEQGDMEARPPLPDPLPLKGGEGMEDKIPLTLTSACTLGRGTISVPVPRNLGGAGRVRRLSSCYSFRPSRYACATGESFSLA